MKKIFLMTISTLALGSGAAIAQGEGMTMSEFLAEYPEANEEIYVEADLDADGRIDDTELQAAMDAGLIMPKDPVADATAPVVAGNTDVPPTRGGDEGLTMSEFLERHPEATEETYVEADLDADGVIDNAELLAATEAGLILPVENTEPGGVVVAPVTVTGSESGVAQTRAADDGLRMAEFLERYPTATEEVFVEADLDADGRIDNSEILAATEAGLIPRMVD